ncbi:MAG: hypothetical protein JNL98_36255 [Bryobacterales bacterium]|nr:hypothetical protein [Bryobacterales bacterium]
MTTLLRSLALSAVAIASLSAAPLTPDYLGVPRYITVTSFSQNLANGGEFNGRVLNTGTSLPANSAGFTNSNSIATKFWCVDSQLYFSFNDFGYANIVGINQLPGLANAVRYGNISANAPADPGWTNHSFAIAGGGTVALPTAAKDRYLMAAYLVSRYSFVGSGNAGNNNTNIQKAIWSIMHNNTATADDGGTAGNDGPFGAGVIDKGVTSNTLAGTVNTQSIAWWVNKANTEYATKVDPTKWAIVSWLVTSQGSLLGTNGNERPSVDRQTFLVQVVPEPGFYGVLAGGLGILLWGVRRRKTEV